MLGFRQYIQNKFGISVEEFEKLFSAEDRKKELREYIKIRNNK